MEASNLQELKDAAIELMKYTCNSCEQRYCEEDVEEEDGRSILSPCSAIIRMRNALSVNPIRQCDVGTADEQAARFENFCFEHIGCAEETGGRHCVGCPLEKASRNITQKCELYWAQLPYVEEE